MRFVSLRWKSLLIFTTMLSLLLGGLSLATVIWFEEHQQNLQQTRIDQQRENIQYVSEVNSQRLLSYLETFFEYVDSELTDSSQASADAAFSKYWRENELLWDLEHAWLVSSQGEVIASWGPELAFDWQQGVASVSQTLSPETEIRCQQRCLQYVAMPFAWHDSDDMVLVLTTTLIQHVISLRRILKVDIALLLRDDAVRIGQWPVQLASLTNRDALDHVVVAAADNFPLINLIASSQAGRFDGQDYVFWAEKLGQANSTGYLLFIDNVSEQQSFFSRYLRNIAAISIAILLLGLGVTYLVLSSQINRLKRQAEALPLLAEKQFERARKLLKPKPQLVADELTLVERAGVALAEQLDSLTSEVDSHTAQLEKMAMYDELTELPNRNLLLKFLAQSLSSLGRDRNMLAVMLIDLDEFKRVNDLLNHHSGDTMLVTVARRLSKALREMDMVGRFGGDEFVVILPSLEQREQVSRVLTTLMDEIRQPIHIQNQTFVVSASMGVTFCEADDHFSAEEMIKQADTAMHEAKRQGKNKYCFFDARMSETVAQKITLEQDLRNAVENQQFCLHLQPQVEMQSGRLVGFEALIRWRHPERGLLYPNAFIDELERSEHIIPVGYWTIEHGLELLSHLCLHTNQQLRLAVNLTPHQFLDPELSRVIQASLDSWCLSPSQLELELTEGILISDLEAVQAQMAKLVRLGVKIAIDDFGTGYSSLAYLRQLPVDVLKIDRSFVTRVAEDDKDAMMVCSILSMAKQMRLEVVAEGIETMRQFDFLKAQQCNYGQGFGIARPIDENRLLSVLNARLRDGIWQYEEEETVC